MNESITEQDKIRAFEELLEVVRKQLLFAQMYLDVWVDIFPTEEAVDVINAYRGFFIPTREAYRLQFPITVCNVTSNAPNSPSIFNLLATVNRNPKLAPGIDTRMLKRRIKSHRDIMRRISDFRNKRAAHFDIESDNPLEHYQLGESKAFLAELQDVFNQVSIAHSGNQYTFTVAQSRDTKRLIDTLKKALYTFPQLQDLCRHLQE